MTKQIVLFVLVLCSFSEEVLGQANADSIAFVDSIPVEIIYNRSLENGKISLGRNHFLSFPGSFDDPSRLLIKYPGISTQNDQANFIIYDGMPPHYVKWTLYDTDIVNPNHLSNAGTISDRNSRASGGVNSFSGQILGNFEFNAQPGLSGDLLSHAGSANMKPRRPFENKLFFNIGVIGLEAGIERKLNDTGTSNLILNSRYSFTGLLAKAGVDFGGETIGFQDFFGKLELDNILDGKLSLFTLYGSSYNDHAAQEEVDVLKDGLDIRYDANIFVVGANHLSDNGKLQSTLIYSTRKDSRLSSKPSNFLPSLNVGNSNSEFLEARLAGHLIYNQSDKMDLGIKFSNYTFSPDASLSRGLEINNKLNYIELYPYLNFDLIQKSKFNLKGIASIHFETAFNQFSFLPGLDLSYKLSSNSSLAFRYNLTSQMQAPELYQLETLQEGTLSPNLKKSHAHHLSLGLQSKNYSISGFYHKLFDLANPSLGPNDGVNEIFTDLSNLDVLPNQRLNNRGKGNIYGMSLHVEKDLSDDFYASGNVTFYKSEAVISLLGDIAVNSPYDFGSVFNVRMSKKFDFTKQKYLKVGASFHYRGGARERGIDLIRSQEIGETVFGNSIEVYDTKLADYHRMDLRISYVKKKSKNKSYKSVISLDMQNVLNRENDAYHFYDPVTESIQLQKQLGMLPVMSYRLEF